MRELFYFLCFIFFFISNQHEDDNEAKYFLKSLQYPVLFLSGDKAELFLSLMTTGFACFFVNSDNRASEMKFHPQEKLLEGRLR